jgi:hypothetical protein
MLVRCGNETFSRKLGECVSEGTFDVGNGKSCLFVLRSVNETCVDIHFVHEREIAGGKDTSEKRVLQTEIVDPHLPSVRHKGM